MKLSKLNICLPVLALIIQSAAAQRFTVKGQLNSRDSLQVILTDMKKSDTLWTSDGAFEFIRQSSGCLSRLSFYEPKRKHNTVRRFFAADGNVTIGADTSVTVSDPAFQQIYDEFNKRYQPTIDLKSGLNRLYFPDKHVTAAEKKALDTLSSAMSDLQVAVTERFIKENKDNLVGAYVLAAYLYNLPDIHHTDSLYRLFDPQILQASYPLQQLRKELDIKFSLLPGGTVSALNGIDINGKPFNSAKLKGRYVVLDFWGTWCIPCISGLPKMKQYEAKYKDRVSFVSIACHDKETRWRAMVARLGMTWTQLIDDTRNRIVLQYFVENFPTKILIGPDGKVVKTFRGEGGDFYHTLDKLMQPKDKL